MELTSALKEFIHEHQGDDTDRLLLAAARFPEIDVPFAAMQIASRRQVKGKLPSWYANDALVFPTKIAAEQCSSEVTARYKQRLASNALHICDLTGGLGIDSCAFAEKAKSVTYIERFQDYCSAARHNFPLLGYANINVVEGDGTKLYAGIPNVDVFYIDPARRGEGNKRIFALQDCEPDLQALLPSLLDVAPKVIAKLSPMADIRQTLSLLPGTAAIHIVAVKNEVKELLFEIKATDAPEKQTAIHCYNYISEGKEECFSFNLEDEREAEAALAEDVQTYLYEPNAAILKAGAFKTLCRLTINKLHTSSHLYTSDNPVGDFPGRTFIVSEVFPFNGKLMKTLSKTIPQANISIRNFPLGAKELQKRTGIRDGGDIYLFATTLKNNEKAIICCRKKPQ